MNSKTHGLLLGQCLSALPVGPSLLLAILAFIWPAVPMRAQTLRERLQASEAQDRANEIIRKERALRNMQQGPGEPANRGSSRTVHQGPSESALKADRVNAIMKDARAAADRGDLREAVRLARAAQPIAQSDQFKAELATWIQALEANIARNAAWQAAEALRLQGNAAGARGDRVEALRLYRRALATDPNCLDENGKKFVADLEIRLNALGSMQQAAAASAQNRRAAPSELDFMTEYTQAVDARHVPSGLPKSVEDSIPPTPAGERLRKGYQAIADEDWTVAKAWFEDALSHEPTDAGLKRLVALAEFTLNYRRRPMAPADTPIPPVPVTASSQPSATATASGAAATKANQKPDPLDIPARLAAAPPELVARAMASRDRYNKMSGEHHIVARSVATSISARARASAAFVQYNQEHGDRNVLARAKFTNAAMRGEGYSKEQLEAQFQKALLEYYILTGGDGTHAPGVGGSPAVDEIAMVGKG